MKLIKKDSTVVDYDEHKIINAVNKSASRTLTKLEKDDYEKICNKVWDLLDKGGYHDIGVITVFDMHEIVTKALDEVGLHDVANSYRGYRNYKVDFVTMLDGVYEKAQSVAYIGDVSNANTDSAMISTQRSIVYGELNKSLYKKFFLNAIENQAIKDGYIYIHDMKDRRDGINCCLGDVGNVLEGGFEMGNIWYNEPKTLDVAFDVISDIVMSMSAQQYGGYTIPRVDTILAKYAKKSYEMYKKEIIELLESQDVPLENIKYWNSIKDKANGEAFRKVRRDFEQGFQSWELAFNTVGSSRGDYPFIAMSFGVDTSTFGLMASQVALEVRKGGQGKAGFKKQVLFPKLTFLYDENLHGEGKEYEWLFDCAIDCSSESMYPDYLSLTGEGYIPSIYKKYGQVVSLMGCRASLSPWYERGGMKPSDENDKPVFEGRCNLGAISLHLPMILQKSREENRDFYEVLDYYLNMIRELHKKTFDYLGEKRASTNPLAWMQGGLLNGYLKANDKIRPLLYPMTLSFGITALNELQELYNGKSLVEDREFSHEVMDYINKEVERFKEEDGLLYAMYAVPAESLCGTQVEQFVDKYGVIKNVSDKPYFSNSFHCHVSEQISPIIKQDIESEFWDSFNGGKIQYCRYPLGYNKKSIKTLVRRAMKLGLYEGVNLDLCYCEDCGHKAVEMHICTNCGSENLTIIDRMNGYLGYTRINGKSRYNKAKMAEIQDRVSM